MNNGDKIDIDALMLPDEIARWIGTAPIYESSGKSGARTVYIDRDDGAYLKIACRDSLNMASQMQSYFSKHRMSSPVIHYISSDRDYLITAALHGEDGTAEKYLSEPERLSEVFGQCLRQLHEVEADECPAKDKMTELLNFAKKNHFHQNHLDDISRYIGNADTDYAASEIAEGSGLLKNDVLMHGDYCLPNIILNDWKLQGFIDVADGGIGDRHYDLAWGLWTLNWNLKSPQFGQRFLNAYGWDCIDKDRLRICGLLAAID